MIILNEQNYQNGKSGWHWPANKTKIIASVISNSSFRKFKISYSLGVNKVVK